MSPLGSNAYTMEGQIYVVDDDESVRAALKNLYRSVGMNVTTFASGEELLATEFSNSPSCIILDVRLRGASGMEIHARLRAAGIGTSVIFLSGYADVQMSVSAMRAGAVDFLTKPFRDQTLLDATNEALKLDGERRRLEAEQSAIRERYETLTQREREVMQLATIGLLNKQIATEMCVSEVTVKIHRANAMKKMHARTFAQLVLNANLLGLTATLDMGNRPVGTRAPVSGQSWGISG